MPDAGFFIITTGLSLVAFLVGLGIGRGRRPVAIGAYFVLLVLLLAKALLNYKPAWEYSLFPYPVYIYFQSYLLFPFAFSCMGLAVGLLPKGRNKKAVIALTAFCFVLSLWMERWMLITPDTSSRRHADLAHHCPQTTSYSCGPAACVMLLSYFGIDAFEGEMMQLCRTPPYGGTSLFRICRGLRLRSDANPARVRIVDATAEQLRALGVPAIISDGKLHVVVAHFEGDKVVLHDPAYEQPREMSFEQYRERYDGPAVVITPSADTRMAEGGPRRERGSRSAH